jgi:uncharacterized membrane protein
MTARMRGFALCGALFAYLTVIANILIQRHEHLMLELDPGALVQMVWLFVNHLPLYSTFLGEPLLGEHFSVTFLALVPIVSGLPSYYGLLALHISFCGLVGYFCYRLATQFLEPIPAVLSTAAILVGPLLVYVLLTPTAYGVQGLAAGILFCSSLTSPQFRRREAVTAGLALFVMATSYEVSLLIPLGLGCYLSSQSITRKRGLVVIGVSLLLLILMVGIVVPHCLGRPKMRQTDRYEYLLQGKLPSVITENPGVGLVTAGTLLLNGGWLGIFQPAALISILPGSGVNFLSRMPFNYSIVYHNQLTVVPGIFLIMLLGIQRISSRNPLNRSQVQVRLAAVSLFLSLASWGMAWKNYGFVETIEDQGELDCWSEAMRQIPPQAPLLMPARLASHLGNRQEVYIYPGNAWAPRKLTEWVLLDLSSIYLSKSYPTIESLVVRDFIKEADFKLRWRCGHLALYQQGSKESLPELVFPTLDPIQAGLVYGQAGFHQRSYTLLKEAARLQPGNGKLWAECGLEAERSGDKSGAQEAYDKALNCNDLEPAIRADILRRLGR